MNKETAQILQNLADKLGTTSEYLWKALVAQAPINSMINIIESIIWMLVGLGLYKLHRRFQETEAYDEPEVIGPVMLVFSIIWFVGFLFVIGGIGTTITGFVNPEYWALKEILSSIKN